MDGENGSKLKYDSNSGYESGIITCTRNRDESTGNKTSPNQRTFYIQAGKEEEATLLGKKLHQRCQEVGKMCSSRTEANLFRFGNCKTVKKYGACNKHSHMLETGDDEQLKSRDDDDDDDDDASILNDNAVATTSAGRGEETVIDEKVVFADGGGKMMGEDVDDDGVGDNNAIGSFDAIVMTWADKRSLAPNSLIETSRNSRATSLGESSSVSTVDLDSSITTNSPVSALRI